MASAFPGSPRVLKGALVVFETPAPVPTNIIAFQFNPDSVTRTFRQQLDQEDPYRSSGDSWFVLPPTESLSMSVELDATDQLEAGDAAAIATGLHPTLAALELLLYPSSIDLILDKALALAGSARVKPGRVPIVLLVWGALRVVPVRVESVSITEEAFDPRLNPIRAKADLGLRTLTEQELSVAGPPFDALVFVNLIAKEVLARGAGVSAIADIAGSASFDFL
jgi:contractile injection system tube protein